MFNVGLIGTTEDDTGGSGGGGGGGGALTASLNSIEYRIAHYGSFINLSLHLGNPAPAGPPAWTEQNTFTTITSLGTAASPSTNTDPVHHLWETQYSMAIGQKAGFYELQPTISISGGTPPYAMSFRLHLDLAGSGAYANQDIVFVGPMDSPPNNMTEVWAFNQNPSGQPFELWETHIPDTFPPQIPHGSGFFTYPLADDWDITTLGTNQPMNAPIIYGGGAPLNYAGPSYGHPAVSGKYIRPFFIGFDGQGSFYEHMNVISDQYGGHPSFNPASGIGLFEVHIVTLVISDSAGAYYDIIQNQNSGSPFQMRFQLQ